MIITTVKLKNTKDRLVFPPSFKHSTPFTKNNKIIENWVRKFNLILVAGMISALPILYNEITITFTASNNLNKLIGVTSFLTLSINNLPTKFTSLKLFNEGI